jgi:hypothetical protein
MPRLLVLVFLALALLAARPAGASSTATDAHRTAQALRWLHARTQLAYSMGECLVACQGYYRRCAQAARSRAELDECKLRRSECETRCNSYGW